MSHRFVSQDVVKQRILHEIDPLDLHDSDSVESLVDSALSCVFQDFYNEGILPNKMVFCDAVRELNMPDSSFIMSVVSEMKTDPFIHKRYVLLYGAIIGVCCIVVCAIAFFAIPALFDQDTKHSDSSSATHTESPVVVEDTSHTVTHNDISPHKDSVRTDSDKSDSKDSSTGPSNKELLQPPVDAKEDTKEHVHNWIPVTQSRWVEDG